MDFVFRKRKKGNENENTGFSVKLTGGMNRIPSGSGAPGVGNACDAAIFCIFSPFYYRYPGFFFFTRPIFVSRSTNRSAHALAQKGWIRGKSLNLGWRDLVAIVTLEAQYNLVRGVEGEEGVVGL